ncbi:MAG: hypothetical protein VX822_05995 [Candidatus Neomarinimicrobiota bacterium]|nr:hypothetical protein [Candidatus Neomarinimicrobiota bacterium]
MNKRFMVIVLVPLAVFGYSPGEIPFDWSGQWGGMHRYGFSGWGTDFYHSPIHFDGNFVQWPKRHQFPFPVEREGMDSDESLRSFFNYRQGDYGLDELSLDLLSRSKPRRFTRFRALKRNFEDYHGLFDPLNKPGGTVQQNYRFDSESENKNGEKWRIASAIFLTTGGVPLWNGNWERGAERRDKILASGAAYSGKAGSIKYRLEGSSFIQRFRNRRILEEVSGWSADLFSHRIHAIGELPVRKGFSLFVSGKGRTGAVSSDTLGNQWQSFTGIAGGVRIYASTLENRTAMGVSRVSTGETAVNFQGHFRLKGEGKALFLDFRRDLQPLPFQFTGRSFMYAPDYFTPTMVPRIRPDSTAAVPTRTVIRAGASTGGKRASGEMILFVSQTSPNHYFERIFQLEGLSTLSIKSEQTSQTAGIIWKGRINYFRDWAVISQGISFPNSDPGWGYFFRHDAKVEHRFRERLFRGRLDARLNLSANFWGGRTAYDWDPILKMGFTDTEPREVQDSMVIFTAEFKAVIQSIELSYVMTNLQYVIDKASGHSSPHTFSPSFLFPPAGRLAYFSFSWHLAN